MQFKHIAGRDNPKNYLFHGRFIKSRMKFLILKFISEREFKNTVCYRGWIILTESGSIILNVEKCSNGQEGMDSNPDCRVT